MRVEITIQGLVPLLMNRFTEAAEISVSSGMSVTFRGDKGTPREQATPKAYQQPSGHLYIPGTNIFACLVAAGGFVKSGRNKLTTQKTSLVPAGIAIEGLVCPLLSHAGDPLTEFEVDSRSVVIPSTGGRIMCHRPRIDEWRCPFALEIDTTMFDARIIRHLVDEAGRKIGLGDYRPQRKGPFGRFAIVRWEAVEKDLREVA
jgi:hypothetical protein